LLSAEDLEVAAQADHLVKVVQVARVAVVVVVELLLAHNQAA
jgi:hypothetical protein